MAEQLFQIGVKGLIRNEHGEILMVKIQAMSGNQAHWDLPGGRMDPGEAFLETLDRELKEELSVSFEGRPRQLMAMLTKLTIPVGDVRLPLIFVIYEAKLPAGSEIKLDPNSHETEYKWFLPAEAAKEMAYKFDEDLLDLVRAL